LGWTLLNLLPVLAFLLWVLLAPLALCVLVLLLQTSLGRRGAAAPPEQRGPRPRLAVLVPAHNESAGIVPTVRGICHQLQPGERVLVVADNCTDDTAAKARSAGAEVVERHNLDHIGKGHALAFGLEALRADAPQVLLIVDADCQLEPNALDLLARTAWAQQRPVQARYLMDLPERMSVPQKVAAFAWRVRNVARPLGWQRIGWPCQLMGTGMAFPWELVRNAALANSDLVEDMRLGVDLAKAGHPPLYCDAAVVRSLFPETERATRSQRTRWEHGHLASIAAHVPGLLRQAVLHAQPACLGLALDLMVPPLALLVLLVLGAGLLSLLTWALLGWLWPVLLMLACALALVLAIGTAWSRHARDVLSLREWLAIPGYVLGKLPIYLRFMTGREKRWVRTDRDTKGDQA